VLLLLYDFVKAVLFAPRIYLSWVRPVSGLTWSAASVSGTEAAAMSGMFPASGLGGGTSAAVCFVIPAFGWRVLFAVAGAGALLVWWAHKNMLESPRWLESVGRFDEAGRVMAEIEAKIRKALPGPASETRETSTVPVELRVLFSVVSSAGGCS